MAATYQSKTGVTLGLNATPQNITLPSGSTSGELVLIHYVQVGASGSTGVFSVTGGSDLIPAVMYNNASGYHSAGLKYKYLDSTDIANGYITVRGSDTHGITVRVNVYRISGSIASVDASADVITVDTTPSYNVTKTPLIGNSLIIAMSSITGNTGNSGSGYAIATSNPSWTEVTDEVIENIGGGTDDVCIVMAHATRPEITATGDLSMTFVNGNDSYGILVVVNPTTSVSASSDVGVINVVSPSVTTGSFGPIDSFEILTAGGGAIPDNYTGQTFAIKVRAKDSSGNTILSYSGTPTITSTGTLSIGSGVTPAFTNGVLSSHNVQYSNTGSFTITSTDGATTGTSASFDIFQLTNIQQHQGNIFTPVRFFPSMSTVKHINIFMAPTSGISGTNEEAAIKFYFNQSATASFTKYVTRNDIAKGYVSFEINKPYVNAMQLEIEYFNSENLNPSGTYSNLGVADFSPSFAEVIYEPTTTIR